MLRKISWIMKKIRHFVNFHQNFMKFLLVKYLRNWVLFSFNHFFFDSIFFWLGCVVRKMDDHLQRPLWPFFIILSKLATILENEDWYQLSTIFFWKVLMKIEGIQALSMRGPVRVNTAAAVPIYWQNKNIIIMKPF